MSTTRAHTPDGRTRVGAMLGLTAALTATTLLTACSSPAPTASVTSARAPSSPTTAASPAPSESSTAAEAQRVPLGQKVALPSDTFEVGRFLATAAPKARKPDTPGTHWASFEVKQCAVTDSRMGSWKVALADGTFASEPTSWPQELPSVLLPYDETIPPGTCLGGRVYVAMPDGATATAIVLEPRLSNPARTEVQWAIGRTSAAS